MSGYFERITQGSYRPTIQAQGAWNPHEIHFSPLGGLIVHAIDQHRQSAEDGKQLGRISFDILGLLTTDDCEIIIKTIRPGRTIELVEATAIIGGRAAVLARAWFIQTADTTNIAGGNPRILATPESAMTWPMTNTWPGGYVASLEMRVTQPPTPGRTTAWLRTETELVTGERSSPHALFLALVDTANGVAVRESPREWMFPNLDLTVHLYRQPTGDWVGLDTTVIFGRAGHGLTSTVLHDQEGPVGRAEQILTLRPLRNENTR